MDGKVFTLIKNDGNGETAVSIKAKKGSAEYGACRHDSIQADKKRLNIV